MMQKQVAVALIALLFVACNSGSPTAVPTKTPPPAVPIAIESLQDLRQAINEIANAQSEQAQAKADALYQMLVEAKRIPLVFGQQVVFLYKGNAQSVTWQGVFNSWGDRPGISGGRIGPTDLWIAQAEMPPASRFEYKITLNDKDWILDPANPATVASNATTNNVLALPGFSATDDSARRSGVAAGTLTGALTIASKNLGYPVQYWVYTPVGYENLQDLPLFYFTDGNDWSDPRTGAIPIVLDNLIADGRIKPAIAIFVNERDPSRPDYNRREDEFYVHPVEYAGFIVEELVPTVESAYRSSTSAAKRVIVGVSLGGVMASFIAARYPDVFHNLAAFSPSMWIFNAADQFPPERTNGIRKMLPVMDSLTNCGGDTGVPCRTQPLKVFASAGFPAWDVGDLNPTAADLQKRGYSVQFIQVQEGHAWTAWRGLADEMLVYLDGAK